MKKSLILVLLLASSSFLLAQKKSIKDYYLLLQPQLEAKAKDYTLKIIKEDIYNGYMEVQALPEGMGSPMWKMALWRDSKGNPLVGIYEYGCGGMGCGGSIDDFKFYNAEMQDITSRIVPISQIKSYFKSQLGDDLSMGGCVVEMPQKGTTIVVKPQATFYPTNKKLPYVELVYSISNGNFTMVKK